MTFLQHTFICALSSVLLQKSHISNLFIFIISHVIKVQYSLVSALIYKYSTTGWCRRNIKLFMAQVRGKDTWVSSRWWVGPGRGWQPGQNPAPTRKRSSRSSGPGRTSASGSAPSGHRGPSPGEKRGLCRCSPVPPVNTLRLSTVSARWRSLQKLVCSLLIGIKTIFLAVARIFLNHNKRSPSNTVSSIDNKVKSIRVLYSLGHVPAPFWGTWN